MRAEKHQESHKQVHSVANHVAQRKPNKTGLPDNLKSGIESLSGHSMDDVKVHYNSARPAQLQAHAFAQGNQIHLAPGQEKHLPHEAWHVVQQKKGRVKPTMQLKSIVPVNTDPGLEKEADVMGGRAVQFKLGNQVGFHGMEYRVMSGNQGSPLENTFQMKFDRRFSSNENMLLVTQLQGAGILKKSAKGGLIISEGILTLLSGIAGVVAFNTFKQNSHQSSGELDSKWENTNAMGITNICSGILKILRGIIVFYYGDEAHCPADILRLFESLATLIGGGVAKNPFAIASGATKLIRSILIAIKNHFTDISGYAKKGITYISSGLHYLEVAIAGGSVLKNVADIGSSSGDLETRLLITHGSTTGLTAISKNRRSKDDMAKAKEASPGDIGFAATVRNWWNGA